MAESIPGGAYKDASGNWVDAEGRALKPAQIKEAEVLQAERAAAVAEQERQAVAIEAQRDPIARAIVAQQLQLKGTK